MAGGAGSARVSARPQARRAVEERLGGVAMQEALPDAPRCYCDACERVRPSAGFERYSGYMLCDICTRDYALAREQGLAGTPGQYVRARRFGDIGEFTLEFARP